MEAKFQNVMNEDVRALKDRLENLNTQKGTSRTGGSLRAGQRAN